MPPDQQDDGKSSRLCFFSSHIGKGKAEAAGVGDLFQKDSCANLMQQTLTQKWKEKKKHFSLLKTSRWGLKAMKHKRLNLSHFYAN